MMIARDTKWNPMTEISPKIVRAVVMRLLKGLAMSTYRIIKTAVAH